MFAHLNCCLLTLMLLLKCIVSARENVKPNIVIIMADDLGWNDVGFHGSDEIPTPNIDALAYSGIILNRHYVAPMCTPTRSAILTGKYPIHTGMQHFVIPSDAPYGLGLDETIMPQYFQTAGYSTHLVGKWHLGFHQRAYTPTMRGFDSHTGYLGPYIDYFDHTLIMLDHDYPRGLDMRKNLEVNYKTAGIYATDYFTNETIRIIENHDTEASPLFILLSHLAPHAGNEDYPMQSPDYGNRFDYIDDENRRKLAGMIASLDDGVGKVVAALKNKNILDNTIILFLSDNGAPTKGQHSTTGSNHPLRGQKEGPWEGAVRGVAAIWSSQFTVKSRVSNQVIHVSDWLPTLLAAAGVSFVRNDWDGINQWDSLCHNTPTLRTEVINIIDEISAYSSILVDEWKLINGSALDGIYDTWVGSNNDLYKNLNYSTAVLNSQIANTLPLVNRSGLSGAIIESLRNEATIKCAASSGALPCNPLEKPCLFNILQDPCEYSNLAEIYPAKLQSMMNLLELFKQTVVSSRSKPSDLNSSPAHFNNTWNWWLPDEMTREEYNNIHALNLQTLNDEPFPGSHDDEMQIKTIFLIVVSIIAFILFVLNIAAFCYIKSLRKYEKKI